MENVFYYWILWGAWIVAAFFLQKSIRRTLISVVILAFIAFGELFVEVSSFSIRVSFIMALCVGYYLAAGSMRKVYHFFSVMTLTSAYAGIHLFEIFDPVWFMVDRFFVIIGVISILALYLGKSMRERLGLLILSMSQGELVFWVILGKFHDGLTIGTADYLNMAAIGFFILCTWTYIEQVTASLNQQVQKSARGKQA
ncbi:hypothetical protein M4D55_14450 [Metabacillus idriensis]|uniref:Uncharacterized protein n=1 Tax=Metabacillus idriensis TaxID=324768 RepID=A0A6I2MEC5_9BACI|nr:hypothetical protein [Metabacillus idriensis]MCM3596969.1 hypothetical protein [Metabacillus idriensis]MRX55684.1 hypothetical protein [Metabacillus idriensis]OHR64441.1 hypothetical protein HMPREF3291_15030 [Bacillus sp. HMSC76G11]